MAARLGLLAAILVSACLPISVFAQTPVSKVATLAAPKTAPTPNGSWPVYHHDNAHTGYDPAAPALGNVQPTPTWTETALDGQIYASPLIHNGLVFAATLNNTVYALDQTTGQTYWSRHLGRPQGSGWTCGNVSQAGILGTPVIDTTTNRIYAVAQIAGTTPVFHLLGLDLGTGSTLVDVQIAPSGFDWTIQQQRGALAVANGYVYVPFGGRAGDCGNYSGWVVAVPIVSPAPNLVFRTPSFGEGVWAAGGVVVDDNSHNVFFATGNAKAGACSSAVLSDAVVKVSPTLTAMTSFQPSDWDPNWCGPDSDLGSASPVLISPTLMFMAGKRGGGFLLDPTNLGGVNGQLYPARSPYVQADVCLGQLSDATFGGFAYANGFVYLECETPSAGLGLVGLSVNTAAKTFTPCDASCPAPDWNAGGTTKYGPPIVAGGAVWAANSGGGGGLTAFNPTTGAVIYQSARFPVHRFVTPAEAGGQVFVPADTVIKSFSFAVPPTTLTPSSLSFGGQAPITTSAAQTVTLTNNQSTTLTITTAALTGANAGNFTKGTDTCNAMTIAANGGTCIVQVSFRPGTYGGFPASLTFTDNAPGSPQTVPLNGMGALDNQSRLYTLDGWGGLHNNGSSPALSSTGYWPGWNIARSVALFPAGQGGYVLDGFGGLNRVGNATAISGPYWGWDIARQVVLAPWSTPAAPAGWTLDGYGGISPFGGAPALSGYTYFGWDIARGLAILPDSTPGSVAGYTLDGWGGLHPFGGAPAVDSGAYWAGWDIARGIALTANASKTNPTGYMLDGYGGLHPFGGAPAVSGYAYFGWDIARGVVAWTGAGAGGWTLDGWGGLHPFGGAPAVSNPAYWAGWDIATSFGGPNSGSGSRRRT